MSTVEVAGGRLSGGEGVGVDRWKRKEGAWSLSKKVMLGE